MLDFVPDIQRLTMIFSQATAPTFFLGAVAAFVSLMSSRLSAVVAREPASDGILNHFLLGGLIGGEKLAFIRMGALPQPGSVSAPTHIAKRQLPVRMPSQRVGLNVGGVKPLLGDAVAQEHDLIGIVNEEFARLGRRPNGRRRD